MNEYTIGYLAFGNLIGLSIASLFYMLGGRAGKWRRRFVGSFILATTVCGTAFLMGKFSPLQLLIYPCLIFGFSLGYGADSLGGKLIRRTLYALGVCSAGLIFCLTLGASAWFIFIPHIGIGLWSIYLGIKNPIHAAAEELFICAILNIGLCMYPFIGGG